MSKAAALESTDRDAHYRAQAEHYLTETNRILKRLASERTRHARRQAPATSIVAEVRAILQGT